MDYYINNLKFTGELFTLFPEKKLRELINLIHNHDIYVFTSGFIKYLLIYSEVFIIIN
jgi:phosphosulfolactate synthase (CoM biosynthesis protein A)